MLKLMKYEFIHSYRTFLISFLAFLVGCLLLPFVMDGFLGSIPLVSVLFGFGFSVLLIGIFFALFIGIFVNYDRSMFKKPAYLTLTLPVSTMELILAKILTTIIWLVIAIFVLMGGFILMAFVISVKENGMSIFDILESFILLGQNLMEYLTTEPLDFIGDLLLVLGSLFMAVGTIYFSLTIVHTKWFRKHQFIYGIIIYFVINIVISWITHILFGYHDSISIGAHVGTATLSLWLYVIYFMILGTLFAVGTIYIIDHHIEIE